MTNLRINLTIIALAWNEANDLVPCFNSFRPLVDTGADTLIVLDHKADATTAGAANRAASTVVQNRFENFAQQRNFALDTAATEWVFFIDPDERATPELCDEILRVIQRRNCDAWQVPRRNFLFSKEVRYTGWYPDYQIRLFRRENIRYDASRKVHELPLISGDTCSLLNPLIHYNYRTWGQFIQKQRQYAPLEAEALFSSGTRARVRSIIGQPAREFVRRFIEYGGWRDGLLGFALSLAMAAYRLEVYRQLFRLQRNTSN